MSSLRLGLSLIALAFAALAHGAAKNVVFQVPIADEIFDVKATVAACQNKPSYAVFATEDHMIDPELERFMSGRAKSQAIELRGSHAIFLSHPTEAATLIEKAAKAAERCTFATLKTRFSNF